MPGIQSSVGSLPGIRAATFTEEAAVTFGRFEFEEYDPLGILVSTTVDNNTPTTSLKPGLLLGKVASSGKYKHYDPAATDGSQSIAGILVNGLSMLGTSGSAEDKSAGGAGAPILIRGRVKVGSLHRQDGTALTLFDKQQLQHLGFELDTNVPPMVYGDQLVHRVTKTANYTIVAADNGTDFDNAGDADAITFTLPAIADGYVFHFRNLVDQNMTIASAEGDNIVATNNATADSISFQTASQKIGASVRVYSRGGSWYYESRNPACTITITDA